MNRVPRIDGRRHGTVRPTEHRTRQPDRARSSFVETGTRRIRRFTTGCYPSPRFRPLTAVVILQSEVTEASEYYFDVDDPELSGQIDELLRRLDTYPHGDLLREFFVTGAKMALEGCSRGDLKILRSAVKEMRHAFRVFERYQGVRKISIFGSARSHPDSLEYQTAVRLGARLAEMNYMVITGAGDGVMGGGHKGAGRAMSIGLNIDLPFEQRPNPVIEGDEKLINFRYFFTRKLFFVKESSGIILMPGGFGTHDEGFETLTLLQTGKSDPIPLIMLDIPRGDYWKNWERFVEENLYARKFVSSEDRAFYRITDDVEEACRQIEAFYRRYHSIRYVDRKRTLVIRLRETPTAEMLERLNEDFSNIIVEGRIEACRPFIEEEDEPELLDLPRISLRFDRYQFSRLRKLIDAINSF